MFLQYCIVRSIAGPQSHNNMSYVSKIFQIVCSILYAIASVSYSTSSGTWLRTQKNVNSDIYKSLSCWSCHTPLNKISLSSYTAYSLEGYCRHLAVTLHQGVAVFAPHRVAVTRREQFAKLPVIINLYEYVHTVICLWITNCNQYQGNISMKISIKSLKWIFHFECMVLSLATGNTKRD